ncbi:MAG: arginine--tRNA ligase [Deltaproteobacteria bacterium]|nr:arginine--tRNA ligase [Deltaproteobacteria bacterium]NIS76987.1 arginine--tRNA ligase [Deltaproteobacteria bacterium]
MREIVHSRIKIPVISAIEKKTGLRPDSILLEKPKNIAFGDYSTNIAMVFARKTKSDPKRLAEEVRKSIMKHDRDKFFSRIEIAGPGFINFFISEISVVETVNRHVNSDDFISFPEAKMLPVIIEFVSANPTGPLHVGHGRGAAFGDSLARILRFSGRRVMTEYYVNDVGTQIEVLGRSLFLRYLELMGLEVEFPQDHYKGEYLKEIAREVKERVGDKYLNDGGGTPEFFPNYGKERILKDIKEDLEYFNVTIDNWFLETDLYKSNEVLNSIGILDEKGYLYEDEGALWFRSTDFGDEKDRVVVRANGQNTYFASDIAYHRNKAKRGFAEMIDILGADHHGYVPRLQAAVRSLGIDKEALKIILVQFVNLIKDGVSVSMSTREGQFETLRDVLNEVGSDAARFFYLMRNANSHLDFDLDLAKKESADNPVYYVQYAHARICSILREARERGIHLPDILSVNGLTTEDDLEMMKKILEFRDVLEDAAAFLEPQRIPFYLIDLARMFHSYYNRFRFIGEDQDITMNRLALAIGIRKVVSQGLALIGVSAPERM